MAQIDTGVEGMSLKPKDTTMSLGDMATGDFDKEYAEGIKTCKCSFDKNKNKGGDCHIHGKSEASSPKYSNTSENGKSD